MKFKYFITRVEDKGKYIIYVVISSHIILE